jgi:glycosyltransferase involved in cell wall biosynthesis
MFKGIAGRESLPMREEQSVTFPSDFKLSVLVPVYNECRTVLKVLARVYELELPKEIIVIDDGSVDGTRELLQAEVDGQLQNVRVLYHSRNLGKGAAIRTAIGAASGTVCLIQDADLEYDPRDYFRLLRPILDGRADVVYGSRFLDRAETFHRLSFHYIGNLSLTVLSNFFTQLQLTDMATGYKVIRTDFFRSLHLQANGFDIDIELTAQLAKVRARIQEVPVSYTRRSYSEGKKLTWRHSIQILWAIYRCSLAKTG